MHVTIENSASNKRQQSTESSGKSMPGKPQSDKPQSGRKVSLGTVPDFEFQGQGVRITGTVAGSPAQKAGLHEGDIIIYIKDTSVDNLGDFAKVLRSMKPGEKTTVKYTRGGKTLSVDVTVEAR
jgi:S1-C subfamily serine protease